jgi:hypothetical protein
VEVTSVVVVNVTVKSVKAVVLNVVANLIATAPLVSRKYTQAPSGV